MKPTYEELEQRIQELEKIEPEHAYFKKALQENEGLFRMLYEKAPLGYQSLDENGRFIVVNQTWLDTLGYVREDVIGKSFADFLHPDWRDHFKENFPRFKSIGEILGVEFEMVKKDGTLILVSFTGKISRDEKGTFQQTHCIFHDITARKQAEEELKRIEWMLSRRPVSNIEAQAENHDQGYGDLTELNRDGIILKSIGHERLKSFASDYLDLLGTSSAIYEINGDYAFGIFASGWCRTMDRASRHLCNTSENVEALASGRWLCHESCWSDCSKEVIAKGAAVDIACNGGIRLYAVPIFAGGNVIGVINFGYGDPPKDPEKIRILADVFHLNHDDLLREAMAYDSRPSYIIEMAKNRLNSTAKLIGSMVETKQAMEALRDSEQKHRRLFETMAQGVIYHAANGTIISANPAAERILGLSFEQMQGKTSMDPRWKMTKENGTEVPGTDHPAMIALRTGEVVGPVIRGVFHPDKHAHVWLFITAIPLFQPGETKPFQVYATFADITDRKQAEEKLAYSQKLMQYIIEHTNSAVAVHDRNLHYIYVSQRYLDDYKVNETDIIGKHHYDVFPDLPQRWRDVHQKALAGEISKADRDPFFQDDGTIEWTRWECRPWYEEDGSIGGIIVYTEVITDWINAEEKLRSSHERMLTILDSIDSTVYVADMDTCEILFMNKRMITDFGGDKTGDICYRAFRKNLEPCECCTNNQLVDRHGNPAGVRIWDDKNPVTGRYYINYDRAIEWTDGRLVRMQIATDITDLKKMEHQLLQAQKMESVGRLAGGVAHDFNNMLGVILGHVEFAMEEIEKDHILYSDLKEIQTAAKRSADTTKQLLAFARKEIISPKQIDLNDTVESMLNMLRRLIGEDIDLVWQPGAHLWPVQMDPTQINQILANLCVNARDAIAGVGKLTIETGKKTFDEEYCKEHAGFILGDFV
ncbi:MAG: PAS domain S-box protein, partial [Desulfotignum sp.]|nr:PAS domain S-box protein [Desulfotignum sp.]